MKRESSPSKASAAAPATAMVVVGKVGAREVTAPNLTSVTSAVEAQLAVWEGYKDTIDSEEVKFFINQELVRIKQEQKKWDAELAKITNPLVESRRQALAAKQAAENLFGRLFDFLGKGERLLKGEILRWEQLVERKRIEAQREADARANEERIRLEKIAQQETEEAARKDLEARERAAQLELEGKQAEAENERLRADVKLEAATERIEQTLEEADRVADSAIVNTTSVKMVGTSVTGKWVANVIDVKEVFAGIADGTTPIDAVRVKVGGRLVPLAVAFSSQTIEGIEVSLPWFNDQARKQMQNFSYRGMTAEFIQDVRVRA